MARGPLPAASRVCSGDAVDWTDSAGAGVDTEQPAIIPPASKAVAAVAAAIDVVFTVSLRPSRLRTICPPAKHVPLQSLAVHPTQEAAVVHNAADGDLSPAACGTN
ncbi:hypothetical protein NicSoilB11_28970 [Arthrobacter sp. NicSoilB11]|nr:hypothetical protein NicSoilB11_28970 [Arthrobacter sp. NicSoilB11]